MQRTLLSCAAVGLWAALGTPTLHAQDAAPPAGAPRPDVDRLIEELGSEDFRVREASSKALAEMGEAARPALEAAVKLENPAIRFRAEQLLDRLDGGPRERPLRSGESEPRPESSPRGGRLGPDGRWRDDDYEREVRRMKEEMDRHLKEFEDSLREGHFRGVIPWGDLWPDREGRLPRVPPALGEVQRRPRALAPDLHVKVDGGEVWAELVEGPRGAKIVITEKAEPANVTSWSGASIEKILASRPQILEWPGMRELVGRYEAEKAARAAAAKALEEAEKARGPQPAPGGFPRWPSQGQSLSIVSGPDGVRITVTELGEDGKPVTKTYEGKSLEELRRDHPEIGDLTGGFTFREERAPRRLPEPSRKEQPLEPTEPGQEPGDEPGLALPGTEAAPAATGPFGLGLVGVEPRLAGHLGLEEGQGALVVAVRPESEAARLGLLADDVITAVNGRPVRSLDEVGATIRGLAPGAALAVDVIRQGKPLTLSRPAK